MTSASIPKESLAQVNENMFRKRPASSSRVGTATEKRGLKLREHPTSKYNLEFANTATTPVEVKRIITDKEKFGRINNYFDEVERMPHAPAP